MVNVNSRSGGDRGHCGCSVPACDVGIEALPAVTSGVYISLNILVPLQIKQHLLYCFFTNYRKCYLRSRAAVLQLLDDLTASCPGLTGTLRLRQTDVRREILSLARKHAPQLLRNNHSACALQIRNACSNRVAHRVSPSNMHPVIFRHITSLEIPPLFLFFSFCRAH